MRTILVLALTARPATIFPNLHNYWAIFSNQRIAEAVADTARDLSTG